MRGKEVSHYTSSENTKSFFQIHTIKNIGLDLGPGIAESVESITGFIGKGTILDWRNYIDKDIVLQDKQWKEQEWICRPEISFSNYSHLEYETTSLVSPNGSL